VAEAMQLAQHLTQSFPGSPQAHSLAGRISYAFGDVARANACWEQALKLNPEYSEACTAIGEAAWEHGNFERSVRHLRKALALNPRLEQKKVFFLADSLMNLGEPAEAAAVLETAARDKPLEPFGVFLLAHAYLQAKQYEKAKEQFEAGLALDPQSANVHFGLATVYARLGDAEKARLHREQYTKLRKEELSLSAQMRAQMRQKDWADPRPVARECYLNAGRICATHGLPEEAEKHWLRAAVIDPESPEPRKLLEALYWQQGRREEAIRLSRGGPLPVGN